MDCLIVFNHWSHGSIKFRIHYSQFLPLIFSEDSSSRLSLTIMKKASLEQLKIDPETYEYLIRRVGKAHLRRRIGVETEHAADRFGQGRTYFHIENLNAASTVIGFLLKISGLADRGRRNILDFQVRHHTLALPHLPLEFEGFTLMQLSDLHLDSIPEFPHRLVEAVSDLEYDICVMTGDYRYLTHGSYEPALQGLAELRRGINKEVYAVLGNHDSLTMAKRIESLGINLLLNEHVQLERAGKHVFLAGIDDPHYFATDNLERAYENIPDEGVSLLLSHSPEIYRHAAYVGFDFMMCGHTHGGQICLPGSRALIYNSSAPRFTGAGAWSYDLMKGYTSAGAGSSVVPARFNCPPEVTLHKLVRSADWE